MLNTRLRPIVHVFLLISFTFLIWWWPYFTKGWFPFAEWADSLTWGDLVSSRHYLVEKHIIPEWIPTNGFGESAVARDPFYNPLSLGHIFAFIAPDAKSEFVFGLYFYLLVLGIGTYFFLVKNGVKSYLAVFGAALITIVPKRFDDLYHGPGHFVTAYSLVPWCLLYIQAQFSKRPRLHHFIFLGVLGALMFLGSGAIVCQTVSYTLIPFFVVNAYRWWQRDGALSGPQKLGIMFGGLALTLSVTVCLSFYLFLPVLKNVHIAERSLYSPDAGYGIKELTGIFFPWTSRIYSSALFDYQANYGRLDSIYSIHFFLGILTIPILFYYFQTPSLRKKYFYWSTWLLFTLFLFTKAAKYIFPIVPFLEGKIGASPSGGFMTWWFFFASNLLTLVCLGHIEDTWSQSSTPTTKVDYSKKVASVLFWLYCGVITFWCAGWLVTHQLPSLLQATFAAKGKGYVDLQFASFAYFYENAFYILLGMFVFRALSLGAFIKRTKFKSAKVFNVAVLTLTVFDFLLFTYWIYPFNSAHDIRFSPDLEQNKFVNETVSKTDRVGANLPHLKLPARSAAIQNGIMKALPTHQSWDPEFWGATIRDLNSDLGYFHPLFDIGSSSYPMTVGKQVYNYHISLLPGYFYDFDKAMNEKGGYVRNSFNALYDPHSNLLDIAGISYLFWYEPLSDPKYELIRKFPVGGSYVYKNLRALPKAYLAQNVEFFGDRTKLLARIGDSSFPLKTTVATEDPELLKVFRPGDGTTHDNKVEIQAYEPNLIRVKMRSLTPSILVITDLFFPDWNAAVDRTPTPIYRVNGAFRGVPLPPGEHTVEMEYRNSGFHAGLKISLLTAALVALYFILFGVSAIRRGRRVPA